MRPTRDQTVVFNLLARTILRSSGCIEWLGLRWSTGYGWVQVKKRRYAAHRLVYEMVYGVIPDGMYVCHTCDNRICMNPRHLFLGTHQDNMDDMARKGRRVGLKGEANPKARFTAKLVQQLREEYAAGGLSFRDLARRHGVTKTAIEHIVNRKNWGHVP